MARTGWSTSNYLSYTAGVATGYPLTMACWAYRTTIAASLYSLIALNNSGSAANRNCFRLSVGTGDGVGTAVRFTAAAASTQVNVDTTTGSPANTWFHACAVGTSATSRAVFLNGANKGTTTTSITPSGINRTGVGIAFGSDVSTNPMDGSGFIAEAAIWSAALTDQEVASLATGVSALQVRPQSLLAYYPIIGNNAPEQNLLDATSALVVSGTLGAAAHPRILMPPRNSVMT